MQGAGANLKKDDGKKRTLVKHDYKGALEKYTWPYMALELVRTSHSRW